MKMKEIVHRYGLGGKNWKKGLGGQKCYLGGHLKIYIAGDTLTLLWKEMSDINKLFFDECIYEYFNLLTGFVGA